MPLTRRSLATAGEIYPLPFVGPHDHTHALAVNVGALTTAEVDADGYLKPGVPLNASGALIATEATPGTTTDSVFGVTVEPIKVAESNAAADLTAAGTMDIALVTIGQVNRAVVEDILGRVLTADEVAAFSNAPCTVKLLA